ncbi:MAG: hypothetical protein LN417_10550 [Candidatus Thermoplasmatota archaeon]|nr:hypothetical protein [Candidatus Thermoplasmatota archaeon]
MNENTLRKLAVLFMIALLAAISVMVYLVVETWVAKRFAETAFLMGISFVLAAEIVYFFERAFTPGEIWWTKEGHKAGLIHSNPNEEERKPDGEEPDSNTAE